MSTSKPVSHSTLSVHGGERHKKAHDAITAPIIASSTYVFDSTAELRDYFDGNIDREEYGNPTVRAAEAKLAALEGAGDCVLFPSGMSAVTTTLLLLLKTGDHVVMTSDCYRRTRQFVATVLGRLGVTSTLVEPGDYAGLEAAIMPAAARRTACPSSSSALLRRSASATATRWTARSR